jgi:diaminohydroxyphosphoribosylaminopyrimidine deaminase / 5-amino-6-(5-phosphoribosylamino)uracil reductase
MDHQATDLKYMTLALELAGRVRTRPWPNPPVGAVVVRDDVIVGRGSHQGPGTAHAERVALEQAGEQARAATLYVTLEPCNHRGRTEPCVPAVIDAGIKRVVFGTLDPNPHVCGGGLEALQAAGLDVEVGTAQEACRSLIKPFVMTRNFERPFLTLKTAFSRDGYTAPPDASRAAAEPVYLTGPEALDDVHRLRRWHDLVLVGSGTLRADNPRLDARRVGLDWAVPARDPLPGCIDTHLGECREWKTGEHLILTAQDELQSDTARCLQSRGARLIGCRTNGDGLDPADILEHLHDAGFLTIFLESGPRLAAAFLTAGLVDSWVQYISPRDLDAGLRWPGAAGVPEPDGMRLVEESTVGSDRKRVWDRIETTGRV